MLALCLIASSFLFAQQRQKMESLDTVLIDSKIPLARKNSGKVIAVINKEKLEESTGKSVAQIVNEISGIEINGSHSNAGQNLGYFVRGGRNGQVVIMVDGVQLNDPSQIANDYDLRLIPATSIEKIEILKGASSVLYGSGAATAVINIFTKKASEKPIAATFTSSVGSNRATETKDYKPEEFNNFVSINGTLKKFFYNASFSNNYVDGLSAVSAPEGEKPFNSDVFNRYDGRINLGYKINKDITISQFFSFDKYKADFDDVGFFDADYRSLTKQLKTGGHFEWKYKKGVYVFNDNYSWIEREIESLYPVKYDAKAYSMDNYLSYNFSKQITALVGLNLNISSFNSFVIPFGEETFSQNVNEDVAKFNIIDPYVNFVYTSDFGLNINTGVRLNNHSDYGTHFVYNFNPSYGFDFKKNTLKILGSYSTAYITPSLYQLYDSLYGNTDLKPEENRTIEIGFEFTSENTLRVSAVYFARNEMNYVDFIEVNPDTFTYQYQNISKEFEASGVEVELSKKVGEKLNITANYTYTKADKRFSLRIPKSKLNTSIGYQVIPSTFIGLNYQYNSEREDSFYNTETFASEHVSLDSFGLLDFTITHQLSKEVTLFANVSNILDEEYEDLYRFQSRGRNMRIGFTISL